MSPSCFRNSTTFPGNMWGGGKNETPGSPEGSPLPITTKPCGHGGCSVLSLSVVFKAKIFCLRGGFRAQLRKFPVVYQVCFLAQGSDELSLFVTVQHPYSPSRPGIGLLG